MPATAPWLASAEAMLNRSVDASSRAAELARGLNGTSLQIEVGDIARARIAIQHGRVALTAVEDDGAPADAIISGSPLALWSLMRGGARAAIAPPRSGGRAGAMIRGDAQTANRYREFFLAARPDAEEELSRWIGDAPARGVLRVAGGLVAWAERARRSAGANLAEYLTEESRDLVSRTEIDEFLQAVDEVRESADRCAARIRDLQRRLQGGA